jgi:hypothetical protein
MPAAPDRFSSVERENADGSIDSEQWVQVPRAVVPLSGDGARALGRSYWREVARTGRVLVGERETPHGVEIRLVAVWPTLLELGPAEVEVDDRGIRCRYRVRGGLLARAPGGELVVSQSGLAQPELRVAVRGFFPRLGSRRGLRWSGALYRQLERRLHIAISRRWFGRLIEEGVQ